MPALHVLFYAAVIAFAASCVAVIIYARRHRHDQACLPDIRQHPAAVELVRGVRLASAARRHAARQALEVAGYPRAEIERLEADIRHELTAEQQEAQK